MQFNSAARQGFFVFPVKRQGRATFALLLASAKEHMRILEAVKREWEKIKQDWNSDWSIPSAPPYPLLDWDELPESNWPPSYVEERKQKQLKEQKGA